MKRSGYLAIGVSLLVILAVFYYFSDIVAYVLVAWVLSMIGQPLMSFFKKLKFGSNFSAAATLITFMFLFTGLMWIFIPPVVQQARNLAGIDYASLVKSLEEPINRLNNFLIEKGMMEGELVLPKDSILVAPKDSITIIPRDSIAVTPLPENSSTDIIPIQETSPEILPTSIDTAKRTTIDSTRLIETVQVTVPPIDSTSMIYTTIDIDSLLASTGDTVSKTNINLHIRIDNQAAEVIPPAEPAPDPTAEIKPSDTPIEKIQKKVFSAFNPARIPTLFNSALGFMGNLLIAFASITFITFFFLREQGLFTGFIKSLLPNKYEDKVMHAVEGSSHLLRRYFVGVFIQVTIITLFMFLVLTLIGIKSALLIAFFAAMINVIPYIGPIIGAMFGIFITISSNLDLSFYNEMLPLILWVMFAFALMQMLDNFILQPYIFSTSVLAHPLEIFIIILVGAKLGGIGGMVIAIPVYTIIRVIAKSFLSEFKIVQSMTKKMDAKLIIEPEEGGLEEES